MPNPNPAPARLARRRRRKPGNLKALQSVLWGAILRAEMTLDGAETPELILKATHALSQAAGTYCRLLEAGELEARMRDMEQRLHSLEDRT